MEESIHKGRKDYRYMAVYGNVGVFDEKVESFEDYRDMVDCFMSANSIDQAKRTDLFLAIIGPDAFKLVKNLCGPTKTSTKTYDQLKNLMNNLFNPEPVVIAERHTFWTALQEESESVCDFIVRLQKLARTCGFGGFLQEALRDRLVSGLHPKMKKTQCHLLAMRNLSFQTAREKYVADELAMKANDLYMGAAAKGDPEVNLLRKAGDRGHGSSHHWSSYRGRGPPESQKSCSCCGWQGHTSGDCRMRDAVCYKVNERDICSIGAPPQVVRVVQQGMNRGHCKLPRASRGLRNMSKVKPYNVRVCIDSEPITMELSTGASLSTIGEKVYRDKLSRYKLCKSNVKLRNYTGDRVPVLGSIKVPVRYNGGESQNMKVLLVKADRPLLFGRDR